LYGKGTIERIHFIQQMQGRGFSLREVGELFQLRERKVDACESVRELLKESFALCGDSLPSVRVERASRKDRPKCLDAKSHDSNEFT
jgi:DNA-binding transcriptional MerR regulator